MKDANNTDTKISTRYSEEQWRILILESIAKYPTINLCNDTSFSKKGSSKVYVNCNIHGRVSSGMAKYFVNKKHPCPACARKTLVCGVGINDADYNVMRKTVDGREDCKIYNTWHMMLTRCYNEDYKKKFPSYNGCSVCEEWLTFSNFKSWMEQQDWEGKHLDKDLKHPGNKQYSPDNCLFVSKEVNGFIVVKRSDNKSGLIGASYQAKYNKYIASCSEFNSKNKTLGRFVNELDAHLAWVKHKASLTVILAEKQTDVVVRDCLFNLAEKLNHCYYNNIPFIP